MPDESPLRVRILQLGRRVVEHSTAAGATVATVLEEAGFGQTPAGLDVRVNGAAAEGTRPLRDGDVITLVPRIKGGRARCS